MAPDKDRTLTQDERRAAEREAGRTPRRRRLRDRLEADEGGLLISNPALFEVESLRNPLLLCDDDLRQTARSLGEVEGFLLAALRVLEKPDLSRADLAELLNEDVAGKVDALADSLSSLRKSLGEIASRVP